MRDVFSTRGESRTIQPPGLRVESLKQVLRQELRLYAVDEVK